MKDQMWAVARVLVACALVALSGTDLRASEPQRAATPWWRQQKIRFHWGHWFTQAAASPLTADQLMQNLASVGATVFADGRVHGGVTFNLDEARLAWKHGIRYFGSGFVWKIAEQNQAMGGRIAIDANGEIIHGVTGTKLAQACPVQPELYEQYLFAPTIEAARSGVVDGLHLDWESYAGQGEPLLCYCDVCFGSFLEQKNLTDAVPASERGTWVNAHRYVDAYRQIHDRRRFDMWRDFADRVHALKPDFIFSAYMAWKEAPTAMLDALHKTSAPVILVDHRLYYPEQFFNWWDSRSRYFREKGYLHVLGTYDNGLFGGRPALAVDVAQCLYDAALEADGNWVWFEQEITPALWETWSLADRKLRAVESVVGEYLFRGVRDDVAVMAVERSGNPDLFNKVIPRVYRVDDRRLVHVNNIDLWNRLTVTLRVQGAEGTGPWSVRDPFSDVVYSPDGIASEWKREDLLSGLTVTLSKRSDLFLLITPQQPTPPEIHEADLVASLDVQPFPPHPETVDLRPGVIPGNAGMGQLLFTATRSMGFGGVQGKWAIGNALYVAVPAGPAIKLLGVKGRLWSPQWSADGRRATFTYDVNGRGQIFVVSADGREAKNLSRNAHCDRFPTWSPDGKKIAFLSDRNGNWEIYVLYVDTGLLRRLTDSASIDCNPKWSPDGSRIAFETNRGGDWDIFIVNIDGTGIRQLPFAAPIDANIVHRLSGNDHLGAWSPDGRQIACTISGDWKRALCLVDVDSGRVTRLLENYDELGSIAWSPDGARIAGTFVGNVFQNDNESGVFTINADGSDVREVMKKPFGKTRPGGGSDEAATSKPSPYSSGAASQPWFVTSFASVHWSADGKNLAFCSDLASDGYFRVYTTSLAGDAASAIEGSESAWPHELSWRFTVTPR